MLAPEIGHGGDAVEGAIFHPVLHLLYAAAADVAANIRRTVELFAQIEEFVSAEMVVFGDAAPVGIDHGRAAHAWPDAVLPVVLIRETTSRPAQHRHLDVAQRRDHIPANAADIRDG